MGIDQDRQFKDWVSNSPEAALNAVVSRARAHNQANFACISPGTELEAPSDQVYLANDGVKTIKAVNLDHPDSGCSGHPYVKKPDEVHELDAKAMYDFAVYGLKDEDVAPYVGPGDVPLQLNVRHMKFENTPKMLEEQLAELDRAFPFPMPTLWQRLRAWFA